LSCPDSVAGIAPGIVYQTKTIIRSPAGLDTRPPILVARTPIENEPDEADSGITEILKTPSELGPIANLATAGTGPSATVPEVLGEENRTSREL